MKSTIQPPKSTNEFLVDRSSTGRVRPWKEHKLTSRAVAASMMRIWEKHPRKNLWAKKRGVLMTACGDYLDFGIHLDPTTGELTKKLDAANFCRDRLCPMCQWRKSVVTFAQLSQIMNWVEDNNPGAYQPIFLTLTMKNVDGADLSAAIDEILKAWSRMMNAKNKRGPWKVAKGWFRGLEITYNAETDTWHPHIHAIILVANSYFDKAAGEYITHDEWVAEWRRALNADYDPSVDVRRVRGGRAKQADAIAEVAKYAVKPGDWVSADHDETDARVELLAMTLKGRRLISFGGVMLQGRKALKQVDAEAADLVHTDAEDIRGDVRVAMDTYRWQIGISNYVLASHEVWDPAEKVDAAAD